MTTAPARYFLAAKYKTRNGAAKRAAFENAMNPGEVKRGDRVQRRHHWPVLFEGFWRVEYEVRQP